MWATHPCEQVVRKAITLNSESYTNVYKTRSTEVPGSRNTRGFNECSGVVTTGK